MTFLGKTYTLAHLVFLSLFDTPGRGVCPMNDADYFHLMLAVFLILMELLMAVAIDYQLHHPEVVMGTV